MVVDPALLETHIGRRVRVCFQDGSQRSVEGVLRRAQGRQCGKVLTDAGEIVFFPLNEAAVEPLCSTEGAQPATDPDLQAAVSRDQSSADPVADASQPQKEQQAQQKSQQAQEQEEAFEKAWLRDAQRGCRGKGKFIDGRCRQGALAAVLAPQKFDWGQFMWHCGNFDKAAGFEKGTSTEFFVVGDSDNNIFSFVLHAKGFGTSYIAPGAGSARAFEDVVMQGNVRRAVVFNEDHAWALRRLCGRWYSIDESQGGVPIEIGRWTDGCGYVCVHEKNALCAKAGSEVSGLIVRHGQ